VSPSSPLRRAPLPLAARPRRVSLRRLRRHPLVYWLLAGLLAVGAAWSMNATTSRARAVESSLGRTVQAPFARHALDRGAVIEAGDIEWRAAPVGLLPAATADDVEDRTVVEPILEGEPVADTRLAPEGARGVRALLPPGTRAVAVPTDLAAPPIEVGDRVDLLAAFDLAGTGLPDDSTVAARDALVVAVSDEAVTVAISEREAGRAVVAVTTGAVAVALVAPE
jgi:Flp pilus assembly protein CpaB